MTVGITSRRLSLCLVVPLCIGSLGCAVQPNSQQPLGRIEIEGLGFTPPPRTVDDIIALIQNTSPTDPDRPHRDRTLLSSPEPSGKDPLVLFQAYRDRLDAAVRLGRSYDRIDNAKKAVDVARRGNLSQTLVSIALGWLASAEAAAGHYDRAVELYQEATAVSLSEHGPVGIWANLSNIQLDLGDIEAAQATLSTMIGLQRFTPMTNTYFAARQSNIDRARGEIELSTGHLDQAIAAFRVSLQEVQTMQSRAPQLPKTNYCGNLECWLADFRSGELGIRARIARVLQARGNYAEAEAEARQALRDSIAWFGLTASLYRVAGLVDCLTAEGRLKEADQLDNLLLSLLEKYEVEEAADLALSVGLSRGDLLTYEGRWPEALAAFDHVAAATSGELLVHRRWLNGRLTLAVTLLKVSRLQDADAVIRERLARALRLYGERSYAVALARGLLGAIYAHTGDISQASQAFQAALPVLLAASGRSATSDDLVTGEERLRQVVYEEALAFFTRPELRAANADLGFQAMSAAQEGVVQAAIEASAVRDMAPSSVLGQSLREDQDLAQLESAIGRQLANAAGTSFEGRAAPLRDKLRTIAARRTAIQSHLQTDFPSFSRLVGSSRVTISEVQSALKQDQVLVSVYSNDNGTYIWAIRSGQMPAFAHMRQSEVDVQALVARVRDGLEFRHSNAVADIPSFDVGAAHELYRTMLDPVAGTWRGARELIIVTHGAMAQIPWHLLVTEQVPPIAVRSGDVRFAEYRSVPWLFRSVSVTHVPGVGAFLALAAERTSAAGQPFLGVGDPLFRPGQAAVSEPARPISFTVAAVTVRSPPVEMRQANSLHLSDLEPLPETEIELKEAAQALGADPVRDLLLGADANEQALRDSNPSNRRVLMFATHGLAAHDLDGLMEPALALSNPSAVGTPETSPDAGLLTMTKILSLKLDADWVVLSACNTAAPSEAGGEAASGLARAFFYAGARSVLLTHWPVETNSARLFTTTLFRNQDSSARDVANRAAAVQATQQHMVDDMAATDPVTGRLLFSYAHPIFWAPFALMGL